MCLAAHGRDTLCNPLLQRAGVHVNDVLEFGKVLLLGGLSETTVGRPFVPGASVVAAVEETFKDAKVCVSE